MFSKLRKFGPYVLVSALTTITVVALLELVAPAIAQSGAPYYPQSFLPSINIGPGDIIEPDHINDLYTEVRAVEEAHMIKGVEVLKTNTQTIPNSTWPPTPLSFNYELSDKGDGWSSANPTKLYAPESGWYMAGGSWSLHPSQNSGGRIAVGVRLNGTTYIQSGEVVPSSGEYVTASVATGMFYMNQGEYIEVYAYQKQGSSKTTRAATLTEQSICRGWLMRIADG